MSKLEDRLAEHLHFAGLPEPVRQLHPFWCCEHLKPAHAAAEKPRPPRHWYHAAPAPAHCKACCDSDQMAGGCKHDYYRVRNWAVDFAWPDRKLIVEVEGGVYTQGRHTRPSGFIKDIEKYNALTMAGWTLLRFSRREVTSGEALSQIERALKAVEEPAT